MKVIVMYDVTVDRQRTRLARLLSAVGVRLQWSVFECTLRTDGELNRLMNAIWGLVDESTDRVRIYKVSGSDQHQGVVVIGKPCEDPIPDLWII